MLTPCPPRHKLQGLLRRQRSPRLPPGSDGWWGSDYEIMYASYTQSSGWSTVTTISDNASLWNTGWSYDPVVLVDNNGTIHVMWEDYTNGWWGSDAEIMYTSYIAGIGWSNVIPISENLSLWNTGASVDPSTGRWIRFSAGTQCPGRCAAGERNRDA